MVRAVFCALWLFWVGVLGATPTSVFWTVCTTDTQPYKTLHIGVYDYFTVTNRRHRGSALAPDIGLAYGLLSWDSFLRGEVGCDYLGGTRYPLFFNGKLGVDEGKIFPAAPSLGIGVFDVGTGRPTRQDTCYVVVGHSVPGIGGRGFVGGYWGRCAIGPVHSGWMAAYERGLYTAKDTNGQPYDKVLLVADYASGKNIYGGGGAGISYYFTPHALLTTGPTFFKDKHFNGRWKWTVQFDFDI